MSRETERPTVVIDMAAEQAARPSRAALVLALLAVLLTAAGLGAGYYWWQQMRADLQQMGSRARALAQVQQELQASLEQARKALAAQQQRMAALDPAAQLEAGLGETRQALEEQARLMAAERSRMERREVELRATIADLRKRLGKPDEGWMVAEAEYLVGIARRRLQLMADRVTALAALREADRRLADTGDEQWAVLRQDIARQIRALEELADTDRQALLERLDGLKPGIAALRPRVVMKDETPPAGQGAPAAPEEEHSLKNLGRDLLRGLKESVRLRHHDRPARNLVLSGQEELLRQNLNLILETARLAVAQQDQTLYRDSLERLAQSVQRHFRTEDAAAAKLLEDIQSLAQARLQPTLPDLAPLLDALRARQQLVNGQ
ncbi:uroporphyrinogen-III C-methyltransferase [Thiolapillus sp.]